MLRVWGALLAACCIVLGLGAVSASASDPVSCPPPSAPNPRTGQCFLAVVTPPGPGTGTGTGGGSGGGNGGGDSNAAAAPCLNDGMPIPCTDSSGYWSNDQQCYVGKPMKDYPASDPAWEGHYPDGALYQCFYPFFTGFAGNVFWAAAPPAGPAAPPDPRELAQEALARMKLSAVNIGIVPEPKPGSVGIIGLPTWMWANAPDETSWGPITRTASAGGYSVTATAKTTKVVWAMGDGSTVVCRTPGTPYEDRYGAKSSPDCGHTYTRQGKYTVRATSYWVVDWAGIGQTGTIPLTFSDNVVITMGEAQVLTQ